MGSDSELLFRQTTLIEADPLPQKKYIWGNVFPTSETYSPGVTCPKKNCLLHGQHDKGKIISVQLAVAPRQENSNGDRLAQVHECPECHSTYWFHISTSKARELLHKKQQTKQL